MLTVALLTVNGVVKVNVTSADVPGSLNVCFLRLSDLCFKSCSVPLLKSDLLLRVAKSMFISSVNHSTFWRPRHGALLLWDYGEISPPPTPTPIPPSLIPLPTPLQIECIRAWPSCKLPV